MRKSFKELIAEYFKTQLEQSEKEVKELQQRVRFREIYANDSYELQYSLVKLEVIKQIFRDISVFLRIDNNVIK